MAPKPKADAKAKAGKAEKPKTPPPASSQSSKAKKPFEEISVVFNGNEVKIRVPKSTSKPPRLSPSQVKEQQSCTCDDNASICSETCGMTCGEDACPGNRLDWKLPPNICESSHRTALESELAYSKSAHHANLCNTCNVTPKDAPKGVKAQKVLHPDKDVFVLKIGKDTTEPNRTGSIEVELITPRAPAKPQPATHKCIQIQCEECDIPCGCAAMPCGTCCQSIAPRRRKCRRLPRYCPRC
ncbi:hypothetical protein PYW07_000422 [Mythimna separata]|uniref:Uncharacterized protein n=1 Tax=Mythimna separata TaxID=271217 RepID=A0AAD7Z4G9_MYTSE|nr:hypothetical protein PYW07_000422 [Mythimna separata]